MAKNKLFRFAEVAKMPHVLEAPNIQAGESPNPAGSWNSNIFNREGPLQLELACGKGEYSLFFSHYKPKGNYVGVDIKGARIFIGAREVEAKGIQNVYFLRTFVDHITEFFEEKEVDSIWIIFPDPYLGSSRARKRLTSPMFIQRYQYLLKKGGTINLKTDSETLWYYTLAMIDQLGLEVIDQVNDIYSERADDPVLTNKTFYERSHLDKGRKIRFISFKPPKNDIDPKRKVIFNEEAYSF